MVLHTRRKATPARNLFPFKVPTFLLRKCTVIGPFFPQIYWYIRDSKVKSALLPLLHFWPLSADTKDVFLRTWPFCPYGTLRQDDWRDCIQAESPAILRRGPNYLGTACSPLLQKLRGHHLVKLKKMFFGKEFWQSLACFVIGGIITVILIKMLERQRDQNNKEQGGRRILIPVQEVGDDEGEVERVVPALTTNIRKFPQEQDEF